jgi:hypothetical protein
MTMVGNGGAAVEQLPSIQVPADAGQTFVSNGPALAQHLLAQHVFNTCSTRVQHVLAQHVFNTCWPSHGQHLLAQHVFNTC